MLIFVNGYGATDNVDDGNYCRYLGEVSTFIDSHQTEKCVVHLCGGYTNRLDLTEARAMLNWFVRRRDFSDVEYVLIEDTFTARDNMERMGSLVSEELLVIFCEYSRRFTMAFYASRLFKHYEIHGVKFDAKSLTFVHQIKQVTLKLPVEVLAWYFQSFDHLRLWLRNRHVMRVRARKE